MVSLSLFSAQAQEKKLDSFTISFASVSGTRAPLWIAKDLQLFEKYLKVEDPRMLESMYKNYLHGSIPARPLPKEEAIQNDIEDLSHSYAHLKGRKAGEFLDVAILKSLEDEGFFKKLYGK